MPTSEPKHFDHNEDRVAAIRSANPKSFGTRQIRPKKRVSTARCKAMVKPLGEHQNRLSHLDLHSHEPDELTDDEIIRVYEIATNGKETDDANMPSWEDPVSVFFSVTKPEIETTLYIKRLVRYAQCSRAAFVVGLVYLSRLEDANPKLAITPFNMHRLLITAIMLAAKNLDDRCYSNAHYARVGGIATVREVNRLELQMLALLRFNIFVSPEMYKYFVDSFRSGKVPSFSQQLARVHKVFPTETRRSAAAGNPALVSQRDTCSQSPSPGSSVQEKHRDTKHESRRVYRFNAPTDEMQVLPIADGFYARDC